MQRELAADRSRMDRSRLVPSSIALGFIALLGCAGVPANRYGVESVRIRGTRQVDAESILACLGTRQRPTFRIDFGLRGAPECGQPPFDGGHAIIDFWSWPWEEWPLFDESVFERDVARIERWYRARGFYEARVIATEVDPPTASRADQDSETCGAGDGSDCTVNVTFTVEEGEFSRIVRVSVRGIRDLSEATQARLQAAVQLEVGQRFDEAAYEAAKQRLLRALADMGYADARVSGNVKVNRARREVSVAFMVEPGQPGVIGRVCVIGYGDLPAQPMLDVAALDPGTPFSLELLEGAQSALYGLGVLSGVEVTPVLLAREDEETDEQAAEPPAQAQPAEGDATETEPPEGEREGERDGEGSSEGSSEGASAGDASDEEGEDLEARGTTAELAGASEASQRDQDQVCNPGPSNVPADHRAVDVRIRVTPGRLTRVGFGLGFQAGQAVTFGTVTSFAAQQDAAQWDYHFSILLEHRNLFDRLIRARLEIRPRAIFEMPLFNHTPADPLPFGVQTTASLRWPAFLEPRTNFLVQVRHDLGPMPFTNFYRSELDGLIGPERTFLDGRLYGGLFVHGNWFLPTERQVADPVETLPETAALWLEEIIRLDLRDDPRNPTAGAYFAFGSQQAVQPLGFWDFVRFTGEVRGYVPLPLGMVLAGRFEIGVMEVFGTSLDPRNVYQLAQLGPPSLQLWGGGASSNRGFLPGLLGDAEQIYVFDPRSATEVANGAQPRTRPVRISGGTRAWEASIELRIPVTTSLGVTLFGDAGDVDRNRFGDPDGSATFRFDHPQIAFGFGLRYRTIIGPIRLDVAFRPDDLQVIGSEGSLPPPCGGTVGDRCRPASRVSFGFFDFPGAYHLTIGEAF